MNKLYEYTNDKKVKIGCDDCKGCNKCCEDMGTSIILDPYDMYMLTHKLRLADGSLATYEILLSEDGPLELSNHDGLIMPNIKMVMDERPGHTNSQKGVCPFLNEQGRCNIHPIRTGLCRLYPLGRNFHLDKMTYFILDETLGCPAKNKSYVSIKEWLSIPNIEQYENFQVLWHNFKKELKTKLADATSTLDVQKNLISNFLYTFYQLPYTDDFYSECLGRIQHFNLN